MTRNLRIAIGLTGLTIVALALDLPEFAGALTVGAALFLVRWELTK